ncbi:YtxH domain-containing protein [Spirosoma koreense]
MFYKKKHPADYLTDQTYLSGLLTGLATGLAIGILFAPKSGKKLRKQLVGSLSEQTKEAKHQWDKTKSKAKDAWDTVQDSVSSGIDDAQDELDDLASKTEAKAKEVVSDAKSGFNRL